MNYIEYIEYLENRYQITLPHLYKQLAKEGMLDWKIEHENWRTEVYPQLLKNPPLLFISYDCELTSPDEFIAYTDEFLPHFENKDWYYLKPEFENHIIIFAICGNGDSYAFYYHDDKNTEPQILRVCHDKESEFVAQNFQDFIVYKLLEITHIGTDENTDEFKNQLLTQLTTHRPYLSELQVECLLKIYQGNFKTDNFGNNQLLDDTELDDWVNYLVPFDKRNNEIEIFEF